MPMPLFDSRNSSCKSPFGAVKTGETIQFHIYLPKAHLGAEPVIKLLDADKWDDPLAIPLELTAADVTCSRYSCTFTPEEPRLYFYFFEVFCDGKLRQIRQGEGGAGVWSEQGSLWQLTVYDAAMRAPAFLREGVIYQIFPDRFARSGVPKENVPADRRLREDWGALPEWRPNAKGVVTNSDYFQGDLAGIRQKLDYLVSLGVSAIYLNPIFEAHANHRYNTADYRSVDPLLGNEQDLRELCEAARGRGIAIILDGVFSHTGSDSLYFNKERRYGDGGAYNDPQSPYRPWYRFKHYPTDYESWWGFDTLPNVDEQNSTYQEFICGEQGVLRKWLEHGVSGYRLDVADELPDDFLDRLHDCVKSFDRDCAIIGEVWEDASNKESYGVRRRYLQGRQLDSVMNYPFRDAIISYVRWGNHQMLYNVVMQVLENYPKPAIQALMNSLSTHDTPRAITELAGEPLEQHDRAWQEGRHYLSVEQYGQGCRLLMLASVLQFGLPGMPCVYYGDEAGLSGYKDPFNRVCYPWGHENTELVRFIRLLGNVRRDYPIFAEADFVPLVFSREICAFARQLGGRSIVFVVNRTEYPQRLHIPSIYTDGLVLALTGEFDTRQLGPFSGVVLLANGRIPPL